MVCHLILSPCLAAGAMRPKRQHWAESLGGQSRGLRRNRPADSRAARIGRKESAGRRCGS